MAGWISTIRWSTPPAFCGSTRIFWGPFRTAIATSAWTRPRTPPGSSTRSCACWRDSGRTSFSWATRTRASTASGRRSRRPCSTLSRTIRGLRSCFWSEITAPPPGSFRRRMPSSARTSTGGTSTWWPSGTTARSSSPSGWRTGWSSMPFSPAWPPPATGRRQSWPGTTTAPCPFWTCWTGRASAAAAARSRGASFPTGSSAMWNTSSPWPTSRRMGRPFSPSTISWGPASKRPRPTGPCGRAARRESRS